MGHSDVAPGGQGGQQVPDDRPGIVRVGDKMQSADEHQPDGLGVVEGRGSSRQNARPYYIAGQREPSVREPDRLYAEPSSSPRHLGSEPAVEDGLGRSTGHARNHPFPSTPARSRGRSTSPVLYCSAARSAPLFCASRTRWLRDTPSVGAKPGGEGTIEIGINRLTVSAHLGRVGVPLRRSGLDTEQTAEAARLYDAGWSSVKLAERFGISADTVLVALRRAAVVIRPRRGGPPSPPAPR
jgi:hypothetical protein